jgi:hypothetical protein
LLPDALDPSRRPTCASAPPIPSLCVFPRRQLPPFRTLPPVGWSHSLSSSLLPATVESLRAMLETSTTVGAVASRWRVLPLDRGRSTPSFISTADTIHGRHVSSASAICRAIGSASSSGCPDLRQWTLPDALDPSRRPTCASAPPIPSLCVFPRRQLPPFRTLPPVGWSHSLSSSLLAATVESLRATLETSTTVGAIASRWQVLPLDRGRSTPSFISTADTIHGRHVSPRDVRGAV